MSQSPEQLARNCAVEYDLHCEAIDDPDIEKLIKMITELLTAHDAEVRAENEKCLDEITDQRLEIISLRLELDKVRAETLAERTAQITAHRTCCGTEHDPLQGKLHGYCVVCGVPWPCEYAGTPPDPHYRERIELEARIAEAYLAPDGGLLHLAASRQSRVDFLKDKLAALDTPKGEVK